jgi:hypothetical protein
LLGGGGPQEGWEHAEMKGLHYCGLNIYDVIIDALKGSQLDASDVPFGQLQKVSRFQYVRCVRVEPPAETASA